MQDLAVVYKVLNHDGLLVEGKDVPRYSMVKFHKGTDLLHPCNVSSNTLSQHVKETLL